MDKEEKEKINKLVEFRTSIEKRIHNTETELEGLRVLLESIDTILLGFKTADILKAEKVKPTSTSGRVIPLKTVTGDVLANLYVNEDAMRVVLAEDKKFNLNTPPFTSFLVERVLKKMQEADQEDAEMGKIDPDKILSYEIFHDGEILRELVIQNIATNRFRELKSTISWTLEKMYEKMTKAD